jgi:hypothetical protein
VSVEAWIRYGVTAGAVALSIASWRGSVAATRNSRRAQAQFELAKLAEAERYKALGQQLRARSLWLAGIPYLGLHWPPEADFVCPACHRVSANGFDLVSGWCAACKDFTGDPLVDWKTAANVLTHFEGVTWGMWWPAGGYNQAVIDAACQADQWNLRRLVRAHPELVTAVWLWKEVPGGREFLLNLCRRYGERAGRRPSNSDTERPPAAPMSIAEILSGMPPSLPNVDEAAGDKTG